jgi:hypothetical protein
MGWCNYILAFNDFEDDLHPFYPPEIDVAGWIRKIYDEAQRLLSQQWYAATGFYRRALLSLSRWVARAGKKKLSGK